MTAGLRQADRESENYDYEKRPCLGERRDVLNERAPLDADVVEGRRQQDRCAAT